MQCVFYVPSLFLEYGKQTRYGSQQGNALYQCSSQDHVGTNVVRSFRLAGNGFYGPFTDLSDTDTGAYSGKTCANRTIPRLYHIQQNCHQRHDTWFL
jgi:hypothetical protein